MSRLRRALVATLLAASLAPTAHAQDSWTGTDKPKHFAVSAAAGFVAKGLFDKQLTNTQIVGVALIPGLIKELGDIGGTGFSLKDMTANLLGAVSGVYLGGWVINLSSKYSQPSTISYQTKF